MNPLDQLYMGVICMKLFKTNFMRGLMHEFIMAPIYTPPFLYLTGWARNFSHKEGVKNMKDKLVPTLGSMIPFWVAANIPIYCCVPFHLRIPVGAVLMFFYSLILSYINNMKVEDK